MKTKTIKQLVDQGISISLNGGLYEVNISGKSTTIFKSFGDAMDFAIKKVVIGNTCIVDECENVVVNDNKLCHTCYDDATRFGEEYNQLPNLLGEAMVGFNKTANITLDDAIRHLEIMDKEYDLDSYTEDVINMVAHFLKGGQN